MEAEMAAVAMEAAMVVAEREVGVVMEGRRWRR